MIFSCKCCGACCRRPGYVRLVADETAALAAFLGLDVLTFTERYTFLTEDRRNLSLIEADDGACIFLTPQNGCLINAVKPEQCRRFPWGWSFPGVEDFCPGVAVDPDGTDSRQD